MCGWVQFIIGQTNRRRQSKLVRETKIQEKLQRNQLECWSTVKTDGGSETVRRPRENWKHGLVRFNARKSTKKWEIGESEDKMERGGFFHTYPACQLYTSTK